MSLAYNNILAFTEREHSRLLIYMRKSKGPKMDPWEIPEVTGSGCHLLRPVGKVVRSPVQDFHWDIKLVEFIQQCLMRHTVKGFAPIKENARNRLALFQIGCQS